MGLLSDAIRAAIPPSLKGLFLVNVCLFSLSRVASLLEARGISVAAHIAPGYENAALIADASALSASFAAVYAICVVVLRILPSGLVAASAWLASAAVLCLPFDGAGRRLRRCMRGSLLRTLNLASWRGPVRAVDVVVGDVLTSFSRSLGGIDSLIFCHAYHFAPAADGGAGSCAPTMLSLLLARYGAAFLRRWLRSRLRA